MLKAIKSIFGANKKKIQENSKFNILIVEDAEVDRKVVCRLLEKEGYSVSEANCGNAGLEHVKNNAVDLIVLDCQMPGISGIEMCRQLKADEKTNAIPVLFLTGVDTPNNILDCYEMEAENCLTKPVVSKVLLSQIEMILKVEA